MQEKADVHFPKAKTKLDSCYFSSNCDAIGVLQFLGYCLKCEPSSAQTSKENISI